MRLPGGDRRFANASDVLETFRNSTVNRRPACLRLTATVRTLEIMTEPTLPLTGPPPVRPPEPDSTRTVAPRRRRFIFSLTGLVLVLVLVAAAETVTRRVVADRIAEAACGLGTDLSVDIGQFPVLFSVVSGQVSDVTLRGASATIGPRSVPIDLDVNLPEVSRSGDVAAGTTAHLDLTIAYPQLRRLISAESLPPGTSLDFEARYGRLWAALAGAPRPVELAIALAPATDGSGLDLSIDAVQIGNWVVDPDVADDLLRRIGLDTSAFDASAILDALPPGARLTGIEARAAGLALQVDAPVDNLDGALADGGTEC